MKEDVFNLKIGNEIYQVDYNHKTGKFTEKKQISPSNNLIVCGLHTIYDKNINYLYDLKIFMDPQKELKHKWKISRDVIERGYNVEKVVESIRKREEDYEKYILPQKNNADLVVNFYSEKKVDILDYKIKDKLNLRLIVDIGRNVSKVKKILDEKNINFFFEKLAIQTSRMLRKMRKIKESMTACGVRNTAQMVACACRGTCEERRKNWILRVEENGSVVRGFQVQKYKSNNFSWSKKKNLENESKKNINKKCKINAKRRRT